MNLLKENIKPRVLNKYKLKPSEEGVYIGRPSKWGNPFVIGKRWY